ncbi:hypothetical protein D3C73_575240 [compost metagenome]
MLRSLLTIIFNAYKKSRCRREKLAGLATSIYLSAVLIIVGSRVPEVVNLPLNELGDFLAGVFGPLAVLWLVLGYYQQGKELKISSQALVAQCEELANSVKQQKLAVELSTAQMALTKQKHEIDLLELEESIRPRAGMHYVSSGGSTDKIWHNFEVKITNSAAHELQVLWHFGGVEYKLFHLWHLEEKSLEKFQVKLERQDSLEDFNIVILCKNIRNKNYGYHFNVSLSSGHPVVTPKAPSATTV